MFFLCFPHKATLTPDAVEKESSSHFDLPYEIHGDTGLIMKKEQVKASDVARAGPYHYLQYISR